MACRIWTRNNESCTNCPCENCGGNHDCKPENPQCFEQCTVCETGFNTEKFEEALWLRNQSRVPPSIIIRAQPEEEW